MIKGKVIGKDHQLKSQKSGSGDGGILKTPALGSRTLTTSECRQNWCDIFNLSELTTALHRISEPVHEP